MSSTAETRGEKDEYLARCEAESDIVDEIKSYRPIFW